MANKITWADKVALQEKPDVVAENKVTAADMNQIRKYFASVDFCRNQKKYQKKY